MNENPSVIHSTNLKALRVWLIVLLTGFALCGTAIAEPVKTIYSTVDLIAEQATLPSSGGKVTVGLYLEPDPSWHAYWINPGDAGLPASISWSLPEGFEAGELQFPSPHIIPFVDLITYGFDEPILLLNDIEVPAGLSPGEMVELQGQVRWVVCDDKLCVPESTVLSVSLPVGDGNNDVLQAERFAVARSKVPESVDWPAQFEHFNDKVTVTIQTPELESGLSDPYLFIVSRHLVRYGQQSVSFTPRSLVFSFDPGPRVNTASEFSAVLVFKDSSGADRAFWLDVQQGTGASAASTAGIIVAGASPAHGFDEFSLGLALIFAFFGGVILNLMPCVFPILSMKALSLVKMAHTDRKITRQSGLLYTAGILVAFSLTGGILLALREGGQAVGWGFQMQNPAINLGLGLLMLAISLNLFGVFEVGTRIAGVGQTLTEGGERKSAFFTGLLAVLVATPCTAPFMAGALGYALVQPAAVALAIFLVLGFGLAFPYLLLSFIPWLGRILPRPGPWMMTFKNILAFPMLMTAVWLFWIIGKQLGVNSMAIALLAALCFAFALWAYGRVLQTGRPYIWGALGIVGLVATVLTGLSMEDFRITTDSETHAGTLGQLELEPFTPERVTGYIDSGQPVFLYFTADWCVSCKVNERVALASDTVGSTFHENGIKVVAGDWTNEDPVITDWLDRYGRVGVPLYLYFPQGSSLDNPAILPQILFPDIVVNAIQNADRDVGRLTNSSVFIRSMLNRGKFNAQNQHIQSQT